MNDTTRRSGDLPERPKRLAHCHDALGMLVRAVMQPGGERGDRAGTE